MDLGTNSKSTYTSDKEKILNYEQTTGFAKAALRFRRNKVRDASKSVHHVGHHAKEPSILTAIASAIINYLLMFGLCCAYGMIMFSDDWNDRHRGLAVKLNLSTAFIMGLLLSSFSKVNVAIGGPDLNPVVFLGTFVTKIAEEISSELGLSYPGGSRRLAESCSAYAWHLGIQRDEFLRRLGSSSSSSVEFCTGDHYASNASACDDYHEQLRITTLFAVAVSSAILSVSFFGIGRTSSAKFVSYVPTNIMEAFLSCVGFKVFKYALKFCNYEAKQFIPAAAVGVPLYFLKAQHVGNPAVVIPLMLLVPLGVFYFIIFVQGKDLEQARNDGLMFPVITNVNFWTIWSESLPKVNKINFKAYSATMVDLSIMIIVCILDNLLKLSSTEAKLPVKVDKDYEIQLHGAGNILTTLCGSSVGYMQLKFNVINYGVMGNTLDRRGGALYAVFCGVGFFWTIEHFNYLPRFFLGSLLFFAGAGFVAENLWGSRKYLSMEEWLQVLLVLAVFIISNSMLLAVVAGALICGLSFIFRYAKVPCIVGTPLWGGDMMSCERRYHALQQNVQHIAHSWLLVVRLKGFIFFASAQELVKNLRDEIQLELQEQPYKRLRYIIFDCEVLDAMDSSAAKAIQKFSKEARDKEVTMLWSSISRKFAEELKTKETLDSDDHWFLDLDEATMYVEHQILNYRQALQHEWREAHPAFELVQDMNRMRQQFEPFDQILWSMDAHFGCPWQYFDKLSIKAHKSLLWEPGEVGRQLYLVHSGAVALYSRMPTDDDSLAPIAVYRHGWFLNREMLLRGHTRHYAVAIEDGEVLLITKRQWVKMDRERPLMANRIMEEAMRQASADMERVARSVVQETGYAFDSKADDEKKTGKASSTDRAFARASTMRDSTVNEIKRGTGRSQRASLLFSIDDEADDDGEILKELLPGLEGLNAAEFLEGYGLFEPLDCSRDEAFMPKLPGHIKDDLLIAFDTYCFLEGGKAVLGWSQVIDALLYSGIFEGLLMRGAHANLTKEEFLEIGHEAAMARLTEVQVSRIADLFVQYDKDQDGFLDNDELVTFLSKMFRHHISLEDVHGLVSPFVNPGQHGLLDKDGFISVVSRCIQKFAPQYLVLSAVKEIWGEEEEFQQVHSASSSSPGPNNFEDAEPQTTSQGVSMAKTASNACESKKNWHTISRKTLVTHETAQKLNTRSEKVQELLWAGGCFGATHSTRKSRRSVPELDLNVDYHSIVSAALLFAEFVNGSLPPRPRLPNNPDFEAPPTPGKNLMMDAKQGMAPPADFGAASSSGKHVIAEHPDCKDRERALRPNKITRKEAEHAAPPEQNVEQQGLLTKVIGVERTETNSPPYARPSTKKKPKSLPKSAPSTDKDSTQKAGKKKDKVKKAAARDNPSEDSKSVTLTMNHTESWSFESEQKVPSTDSSSVPSRKLKESAPKRLRDFVLDLRSLDLESKRKLSSEERGLGDEYVLTNFDARKKMSSALKKINHKLHGVAQVLGLKAWASAESTDTTVPTVEDHHAQLTRIRTKLYLFLEVPKSSNAAFVYSIVMCVFIIASILFLMGKSLFCTDCSDSETDNGQFWFISELILAILFTIEYLLRLSVADIPPTKTFKSFIVDPMNVCDLVAVLPGYIELFTRIFNMSTFSGNWALILKFGRLFRLTRFVRLKRLESFIPHGCRKLAAPVLLVCMVIWGIYIKEKELKK